MKRKRICCLLLSLLMITTYTIGGSSLTVKAWKQTDHQASVEKLKTHDLFSKMVSHSLVRKVAGYTDTQYGTSSNATIKANGLHGVGNYVANLKFLYGVVWRYLYKTDANPVAYFTKGDSKPWMDKVDSDIIAVVKMEAAKEKTRKGKASRILGLAVHLIGDIYAHRVIVPKSTISGVGKQPSGNKLGKVHFTSKCTVKHTEKDIRKFVTTFEGGWAQNEVCHSWSCVCKAINSGLLETMDIKYFMVIPREEGGKVYEDNIKYYSSRFTTATNWTLDHVFDGLNAKTTNIGKSFFLSGKANYNTTVFTAELNKFSTYCTSAGSLKK